MILRAQFCKLTLNFRFDAGTSRGVLKNKDSFFIKIYEKNFPERFGLGEAGPLLGLSKDFDWAENKLRTISELINKNDFELSDIKDITANLHAYPSVLFAIETAILDFKNGGNRKVFENDFFVNQSPISINGLVWMGEKDFMLSQIDEKIKQGFNTIKIKVGAIDLNEELEILKYIRKKFSADAIEIRLDANGAFSPENALEKLEKLSKYHIHSIEQPIQAGQMTEMAKICKDSPIPIVLDEELIGQNPSSLFLTIIKPAYIILKPSLIGGFVKCKEWIAIAEAQKIPWWITSALESNIGLNAISQFVAGFDNKLPQGLGTGALYHNNVDSPLEIAKGAIFYNQKLKWNLENLSFKDF
jgi:o-succinylbenzoate synthase